jgi:hypothetical protein
MPGSKINVLLSLKALERAGEIQNLASSTMILANSDDLNWRRGWDDQVLILKKGGFQKDDVANAIRRANEGLLRVMLAPEFPTDPAFQYHRKIIDSASAEKILDDIKRETGLVFDDFTDDRPFVHQTRPQTNYSSLEDFTGAHGLKSAFRIFLSPKIFSLLLLATLTFVVFVFVVFFVRSAPSNAGRRNLTPALRAGFGALFLGLMSTAIQLIVAYKSILFFGNPTYALVASCLGTAGGSLVGAIVCRRLDVSRRMMLITSVLSLVFFLIFIFLTDCAPVKSFLFSTSLAVRQILILACCLIFSSGLGLGFPLLISALQRRHRQVLHLAICIDGLACALCAVFGPTVIEDIGLRSFAYGIVFVSLIAILCVSRFAPGAGRMSS